MYVKVICSSACRNGKVETESFRSAVAIWVGRDSPNFLQFSRLIRALEEELAEVRRANKVLLDYNQLLVGEGVLV